MDKNQFENRKIVKICPCNYLIFNIQDDKICIVFMKRVISLCLSCASNYAVK